MEVACCLLIFKASWKLLPKHLKSILGKCAERNLFKGQAFNLDMIKEIVEGKSYLGDLQAETYEEMINEI